MGAGIRSPSAPASAPARKQSCGWMAHCALLVVPGLLAGGEIKCASAASMDGLMALWCAGFAASHPETPARVGLRAKYSADFVEPLARGEVDVAAFARELFPAEREMLAAAGRAPMLVPVAGGSRDTKGGTHAIVMYVNSANPLAQLSLGQLREIWAEGGAVTTWGQLGLKGAWAQLPIHRHGMKARRDSGNPPGIVNFLEARLLAGRGWRDGIEEHVDAPGGAQALEQIVRAVAADPAAIGYSGFAYQVPGVKPLALGEREGGPYFDGSVADLARGDYPLGRAIYLCAGPAPSPETLAFLHYVLSPEGQATIGSDKEGFLPLPPRILAAARVAADPQLPAYAPQPVTAPADATYRLAGGAIAVIGYNDMAPLLEVWSSRFSALHPGLRFALALKGTRTAPPALADGSSAFAPMGAEFSPEQLQAYRTATGGRDPVMFRVAHASLGHQALSGPLALIVHHDNPRETIALDEAAAIFAGHGDRGLHPVGLAADRALGVFFRERLGLGARFGPGFRAFAQSSEVVHWVEHDPDAIGFAAVNRVTAGVKVLAVATRAGEAPVALNEENVSAGRYPLDRFLLIYARAPLEPLAREYLRFVLSRDGQAVVAADPLGYLPLNAAELTAERSKLPAGAD